MKDIPKTAFVPQLAISHGTMDLEFYKNAFDAIETKHITNDDGSIHVSEMFIDGAMFHFHEEAYDGSTFSPGKYNGVTTTIGLMVADVDSVMARALAAGATETSPAKSYDYGYRQGEVMDPLGHRWLIEMVI
ncbi:MAG TPA: VOC family protein [Chitinophagaceae bacterium]|nr:VOC family protein [Chitinophagaceae bacterium]